mgnify:CR=1 FL=1
MRLYWLGDLSLAFEVLLDQVINSRVDSDLLKKIVIQYSFGMKFFLVLAYEAF